MNKKQFFLSLSLVCMVTAPVCAMESVYSEYLAEWENAEPLSLEKHEADSQALVVYQPAEEILANVKPAQRTYNVDFAARLMEELQAPHVKSEALFSKIVRQEQLNLLKPVIESLVDEQPQKKALDMHKVPANVLRTVNLKPFILGALGVSAAGVLYKLYKNSAYYQYRLLQSWQKQVADDVENVVSGTQDAKISAIELSQLTRLTDEEREQLAKAHNSLVEAVACPANVQAVKAAHTQFDTVVNNCRNTVAGL
jgi:hypothetical protein